jgi:hypothetical protein
MNYPGLFLSFARAICLSSIDSLKFNRLSLIQMFNTSLFGNNLRLFEIPGVFRHLGLAAERLYSSQNETEPMDLFTSAYTDAKTERCSYIERQTTPIRRHGAPADGDRECQSTMDAGHAQS